MNKTSDIKILLADSGELRNKAFDIRREVFVIEQEVAEEEEFDEYEDSSRHMLAVNEKSEPVGAARWRETSNGIKLERFVVKKSLRGDGLGGRLVQAILDDIKNQKGPGHRLYMHAQIKAIPLYERYGFKKIGDLFEECNILHYEMEMIN